MQIITVKTAPFADQNPGTSGLRKRVSVFSRPHYAENFIQAVFNSIAPLQGKILVFGGDGRYYNYEVMQKAVKMAIAAGVGKIIIGQNGILSTPAASHIIRKYQAYGGLIFSASHNAGGPEGDFGIKYNIGNGGPAPEKITQAIFAESAKLASYKIAVMPDIVLKKQGSIKYGETQIEVVDSVRDYADMMEDLFDFALLRRFCASGFAAKSKEKSCGKSKNSARKTGLKMRFDAMNAVTGSYAYEIFVKRLGLPQETVTRGVLLPDFGNTHPDPNPVYAKEIYQEALAGEWDFAAASDGDGDRNMILGKGIYVSPSDSLAIIAAHMRRIKAYKNTAGGVARSMPTSMAVDRVAEKLGMALFETPTGWKFFSNLLDSGKVILCGEESFGTGSNHIREKDGIWAVLIWLNILAVTGKGVKQLVEEHWARFGRNYYSRHDYEGVDSAAAQEMMENLREKLSEYAGQETGGLRICKADDFAYHDSVDGSISRGQGIRFLLENKAIPGAGAEEQNLPVARLIFRLSGTGTQGATLRLYLEYYEADRQRQNKNVQEVLKPLARLADTVAGIKTRLNRSRPTVIV